MGTGGTSLHSTANVSPEPPATCPTQRLDPSVPRPFPLTRLTLPWLLPATGRRQRKSAQLTVLLVNGCQHIHPDNDTSECPTRSSAAKLRVTGHHSSCHPNPGTNWFGVYEDFSDQEEKEDEPTDMDTANTQSQDRSRAAPPASTEPIAHPPVSADALIQAAIEEARRAA
jgi:hypothetical protein